MLDEKLKEIHQELKPYYGKQEELIEKSREKKQYLTTRVDTYLQRKNLENIDIRKTAKRLCCSKDLIEKRYHNLLEQQKPKEKVNVATNTGKDLKVDLGKIESEVNQSPKLDLNDFEDSAPILPQSGDDDEELYDLQKELEAKFDELFGPLD